MVLEGHLFLASLSDVHRRCCPSKLHESGGSHPRLEVFMWVTRPMLVSLAAAETLEPPGPSLLAWQSA